MSRDLKELLSMIGIFGTILLVIIGILAWLDYVQTGWKQQALERQGIHMTTWDVWVLDPKVRVIDGKIAVEEVE